MVGIFFFLVSVSTALCIIWGFVLAVISSVKSENQSGGQNNSTDLYGNTAKPPKYESENHYDDYTDGIDETTQDSFSDIVGQVVSDITGKSFENIDDPISGDDDDDPIKFK